MEDTANVVGGQTAVSAPHYPMYVSPLNFKDPLDFVPERWMGDERYAGDRKAALQPFSNGARDCLGKKYVSHPHLASSDFTDVGVVWQITRCVLFLLSCCTTSISSFVPRARVGPTRRCISCGRSIR